MDEGAIIAAAICLGLVTMIAVLAGLGYLSPPKNTNKEDNNNDEGFRGSIKYSKYKR